MPASAVVLLNRLLARGKFRHVQVLLRVAETGSAQRAADAIGLTQSSVTQTLAYLEDLLEVELFERHARGMRPTPVCLHLLPVARQMLLGLAEGADLLEAQRVKGAGTLRLLCSGAALRALLLPVLPEVYRRFPNTQLHLREGEGEDQLLAVARGEVDLVLCRRPAVAPESWRFEVLADDQCVVVCGAAHPLARRHRVVWDELAGETWLRAPAETVARRLFDEWGARWDTPPRTHPLVTRSIDATLSVLRHERVLALLPRSFVGVEERSAGLRALPLPNLYPMDPLGALLPHDAPADLALALVALLRPGA